MKKKVATEGLGKIKLKGGKIYMLVYDMVILAEKE